MVFDFLVQFINTFTLSVYGHPYRVLVVLLIQALEFLVLLANLLLEINFLISLFAEAGALLYGFLVDVYEEDEVGLDHPTICIQAPIIVQALSCCVRHARICISIANEVR